LFPQSRPVHVHGIDFVSSEPHIFTDHIQAEDYEQVLQPGMVLVIEPNAVTADGMSGIFFGHTFIITEGEPECVDGYPWELTVVRYQRARACDSSTFVCLGIFWVTRIWA